MLAMTTMQRCRGSGVNCHGRPAGRPRWYCGSVISARFDERHVLPLAMFFGSFSWSFVDISLPFHIQRISTSDAALLAWSAPGALYASLALIGLACVPLARGASPRHA
jgi:hypothetical protein